VIVAGGPHAAQKADLPEVARADGSAPQFQRPCQGGEQGRRQKADNRDDYQKFKQRKAKEWIMAFHGFYLPQHGARPERLVMGKRE
jgi:hypothetical protein